MRYIVNGTMLVGGQRFWRIDDLSILSAPDYSPVEFLTHPFMLIAEQYANHEEAERLVKALNAAEEAIVGQG